MTSQYSLPNVKTPGTLFPIYIWNWKCIFPKCIFPNCIFPICIFPTVFFQSKLFQMTQSFSKPYFCKLYYSKLWNFGFVANLAKYFINFHVGFVTCHWSNVHFFWLLKTETTFSRQHPPKLVVYTFVSCAYHIWVGFQPILNLILFEPFQPKYSLNKMLYQTGPDYSTSRCLGKAQFAKINHLRFVE